MKSWMLGIALIASACNINGKGFGPRVGSSTTTSSSSADADGSGAGKSTSSSADPDSSVGSRNSLGTGFDEDPQGPPDGQYHKLPPYPSAPADPWVAVAGDQPKRWAADDAEHWTIRGNEFDCSAAHDHCIDKDAWFLVRDRDLEKEFPQSTNWTVFGPDEPANSWNARRGNIVGGEPEYTAFRTVPATRHNLSTGAAVIALDRTAGKLHNGIHSHDALWLYGVVEDIDLDIGVFRIKNHNDSLKLSGARVVVLTWKPGDKVKIVGGRKRNELAVKVSDLFAAD